MLLIALFKVVNEKNSKMRPPQPGQLTVAFFAGLGEDRWVSIWREKSVLAEILGKLLLLVHCGEVVFTWTNVHVKWSWHVALISLKAICCNFTLRLAKEILWTFFPSKAMMNRQSSVTKTGETYELMVGLSWNFDWYRLNACTFIEPWANLEIIFDFHNHY